MKMERKGTVCGKNTAHTEYGVRGTIFRKRASLKPQMGSMIMDKIPADRSFLVEEEIVLVLINQTCDTTESVTPCTDPASVHGRVIVTSRTHTFAKIPTLGDTDKLSVCTLVIKIKQD